jgi:hypothetical protein
MRIQMTMTALDEDRWAYLQANVRAKYEIPEGVGRVCLAFSYGEEERHVEMPLALLPGLLAGLGTLDNHRRAMAALTPDALPDFLESRRNAADPQRAEEAGSTGPSYGAGPGEGR